MTQYYYPTLSSAASPNDIVINDITIPETFNVLWSFIPPTNLPANFIGPINLPPLKVDIEYVNPQNIIFHLGDLNFSADLNANLKILHASNEYSPIKKDIGSFEINTQLEHNVTGVYLLNLRLGINSITGVLYIVISIIASLFAQTAFDPSKLLELTRLEVPPFRFEFDD